MFRLIIFLSCLFLYSTKLSSSDTGSVTGYKIPRFVSLKSNDSNIRIGPSTNYPIILKYNTQNYPVKIIDEHENWRKIYDINANEGWINKNLVKGERFAIINPASIIDKNVKIFSKPKGKLIGTIGKLNIVKINICLINWCKISYQKYSGWIKKSNIWGSNPNETINIPFYQPLINLIWKINFFWIVQ
jgi:SH3-like domain-containing protein